MKAVTVVNGTGPSDALRINNIRVPKLKENEVLVQVYAFAINPVDIQQRSRKIQLPDEYPSVLGVEFSGEVVEMHSEMDDRRRRKLRLRLGDRVCGYTTRGSYAEYVACDIRSLMKIPAGLTWVQAAAISYDYFVSVALCTISPLTKRDKVLVHNAASSLGSALTNLVQAYGCRRVFAITKRDEDKEWAKKELTLPGALKDQVIPINAAREVYTDVVKKFDPAGIDLVIDTLGAGTSVADTSVLKPHGRLTITQTSSVHKTKTDINLLDVVYKRLQILGFHIGNEPPKSLEEIADTIADIVIPAIVNGKFKLEITKIFTMEQIAEAHKYYEDTDPRGKVVCTVIPQPYGG